MDQQCISSQLSPLREIVVPVRAQKIIREDIWPAPLRCCFRLESGPYEVLTWLLISALDVRYGNVIFVITSSCFGLHVRRVFVFCQIGL